MTAILEPTDEDADNLDDESLLHAYLEDERPAKDAGRITVANWPPTGTGAQSITLPADTLAWFRANHADWRQEIDMILRGWIAARSRRQNSLPPP